MKFAFIADIHLSKYGQDSIDQTSKLPKRLHMLKDTLYQVAEYCIEHKISNIVIGGDILHGKSIIYAIAQKVMLEYFRHYIETLYFYVIDGNHDVSGKSSDAVSALESLGNEPNVKWIAMESQAYGVGNILFVPYSTIMTDIIKKQESDILISHFGLNEGILNSGISIVSDISMNDLIGRYKLVLLGHYHKPQEIINDQISIYYVGSPIQLDWGEKQDDKRFLVVDSNDLSVQEVPTVGYSKHIELTITNENKQEIFKKAVAFQKDGHKVRIIKEEQVDLSDIDPDVLVIDKTEQDITNRGISISMSESERLKRYLEVKEIPEEQHEHYMKVAINLIGGLNEEHNISTGGDEELRSLSRPASLHNKE